MLGFGAKPRTSAELGRIGEDHAARFLVSRGYRIRERNFRLPGGGAEIDIVAEQKDVLAFVEVKTRSSTDFAQPHQGVTAWKQRQIIRAASVYLAHEGRERLTRFDVVEVILTPSGRVQKVDLISGAFRA